MIETRFEPADPSAKRVCANIEIYRAKGKWLAGDAVEVEERQATTRAATHAGAGGPSRILIACMPKSGSTFLSDLISALPDFKRAKFSASPSDGRQHELDEASLKAAGRGNFVGQVHVLYNTWTAKMCKDYRLKPVVLVRSLPDVIVSQRDHIRREGGVGPLFRADPNLTATDDATVEEMIVRFQASWYVNFYMSWRDAPGTLMISYEELTADPRRTLAQILDFAGAGVDERAVAEAVAKVQERRESRFNVGVPGRGAKLRPETLRDLARLFDFYPQAADDPYVKGVRAQVAAALEGREAPRLDSVAFRPPRPAPAAARRPSWSAHALTTARRYGYQASLIAVGLFYWVWPEDILPDDKWYGHIDDAVFLTILAFLAGGSASARQALATCPSIVSRFVSPQAQAHPLTRPPVRRRRRPSSRAHWPKDQASGPLRRHIAYVRQPAP